VLAGTNRANEEGCSRGRSAAVVGNLSTRARVWVFYLPPATSAAAGRKELCRRSFAVFRPMAPVRVHPPPGRGGSRQSEGQCRWVSHKQGRGWNGPARWGWDSRSPAAALWSDSASKRAHSKRCADRRRRAGSRQRMDCGGLPPLCGVGWVGSRLSHGMLSPRVEARALGLVLQEGRCVRENGGPAPGLSVGASVAEGR
jgi:hypothetical protein